jgi:uncharacterized protein YjbI with pentapeptide repeats
MLKKCSFDVPDIKYRCEREALKDSGLCLWHQTGETVLTGMSIKERLRFIGGNDFVGFRLNGADLRRTELPKSDLRFADLSGADLSDSFLRESNLEHVTATHCRFTGANMFWSNMSFSDLSSADFREGFLNRCKLISSRLDGVNFTMTQIMDAFIEKSSGKEVCFDQANIAKSRLAEVVVTCGSFRMTDLLNSHMQNCQIKVSFFTDTMMMGAEITNSVFTDCIFEEVNMRHCCCMNVRFVSCRFSAVDFSGSTWQKPTFKRCTFENCANEPKHR